MGALRWLILVPVYFFGAISLCALLGASARLFRLDVAPDRLARWAVGGSIGLLVALFGFDVVGIEDMTLASVLGLLALSFLLAAVLPLSADRSSDHRRTSDPQVL